MTTKQRAALEEALALLSRSIADNAAALATCGDDQFVLAWKHHLAVRIVAGKASAVAPRLATVFSSNARLPRISNGAGEVPTLTRRRDAVAADTAEIERTMSALRK